jgi:hypothetical protein
LQIDPRMKTISSISHALLILFWPAAGQLGCGPDTPAVPPDIADCPVREYRVARVVVPATPLDSIATAFDLDDDGVRDNWLGFAHSLVRAWSPAFQLGPVLDARLDGPLDWRLAFHQCENGGAAAVSLFPGPGSFDDAAFDAVVPATGDRSTAVLAGGTFALPLGALGDALGDAPDGWVAAPLAQVRVDAIDSRTVRATVGVGVTIADVYGLVAPALAAYFTDRLAAHDSDFAVLADTNHDGTLSTEELLASETAQLLLAPDLEDMAALAGDGASLGVRIEAERE